MFVKKREKSLSLLVMEALACRMVLTGKALFYLQGLQKGYFAELTFDQWLEVLGDQAIVFPDLLLQPRYGNPFQLDAVVLIDRVFYLYEVKSMSGEHRYGNGYFLNQADTKIVNPEIRLTEKIGMFQKLLDELGFGNDFRVVAHVVLVDPNCTMFYAPEKSMLLLPTQLSEHMEKLKGKCSPLTNLHRRVTQALLASQGEPKLFEKDIPAYTVDSLKKGVYCPNCKSWDLVYKRESSTCKSCNQHHKISELIKNSVQDFQSLFPNKKIDSSVIYTWCGSYFSKKRILQVLKNMDLYQQSITPTSFRKKIKTGS